MPSLRRTTLKKMIAIFTLHSVRDQMLLTSSASNAVSKHFDISLMSTEILIANTFQQNLFPVSKKSTHRIFHLHIYVAYRQQLGDIRLIMFYSVIMGINISAGRVYRLMKQLHLPKISANKPLALHKYPVHWNCCNHLKQNFGQKSPTLV